MQNNASAAPFSAYYKRETPAPDGLLTQSGPGTPLGEYMRRFWQPVCMTNQLRDVPLRIRILGEDLVAFRDKSGSYSVMQRHCVHRGASLEFGIIQEHGIRCAYHGFQFAPDGTIINAPAERDCGKRLATCLSQGAYPTHEKDGLLFAFMGPPNEISDFPLYDAFDAYSDNELVPFSNVFPCNWLQVIDNIADQMHTSVLHNPTFLFQGSPPEGLDIERFSLNLFAGIPVIDYIPVRSNTAMVWMAGRRVSDDLVWIRMNDLIVPNISQHASLFEDGKQRRIFHRVHMSRWYVPVDDTNSIIYGWRMFGKSIDPNSKGRKHMVGWDQMDFLGGQVGDRTYEEGQKLPGDWEVIVGQRPIAIHALENPVQSDVGVYMLRKLIREAITGTNSMASSSLMEERSKAAGKRYCYTQNNVLKLKKRSSDKEDQELIGKIGKGIVQIMSDADSLSPSERNKFVVSEIEKLEAQYQ